MNTTDTDVKQVRGFKSCIRTVETKPQRKVEFSFLNTHHFPLPTKGEKMGKIQFLKEKNWL